MACRGCGKRRQPANRDMPSLFQQAWNLTKAAAAFAAQPGFVDRATYQRRLAVCEACDKRGGRLGHKCSVCGCRVAWKAQGAAWDCPLGKWPGVVEPAEEPEPQSETGESVELTTSGV